MTTMSARQLRRKLQRAASLRTWTLRQKIAVGVWIPVLVVALALFTGPNRSSSAASAPATTTTTFDVTVATLQPIVPGALSKAPKVSVHDRVVKFVNGVPPKRSRAERLALLKYQAANRRIVAGLRGGVRFVIRRRVRP